MIVVPVIERELRAAARHAQTYNLRVLGVVGLLCVLAMFWLHDYGGPGAGGRLFGDFHRTLFLGIWILVPLLTADCISRERREGTLPLLFLTPLRARDIVYAKGFAHGLRSFTLWLAVLPIFTICFLGGGVDWSVVTISALVNFSSVCLALGAGIVASGRTRLWARSLALAAGLAFTLLVCFVVSLPWFVLPYWGVSSIRAFPSLRDLGSAPDAGLAMALDAQSASQFFSSVAPGILVCSYASSAFFCAVGLVVLARFAAWNVNRTWQERPPSPEALRWKERLFKPVLFRSQLRGWLRWQLERNPVGWLEQRSWSGRLVVWSWFAVVVCVYSSLFANLPLYQRGFHFLQGILAALLAGSLAASAAGSFRRERETGVLELLLVAPLSEWQIIAGRVRGLWAQFLPASALLCTVWLYGATFLSTENELVSVLSYLVTFATLPVVGLYFSLAKPNFVAAFVWTLLVQVVLPEAALLASHLDYPGDAWVRDSALQGLVQIAVAVFLGWRLLVLLRGREFVKATS